MAEWFFRLNGTSQGPVSEEDLKHIFDSGALTDCTPVWKEGMRDWAAFGTTPLASNIPTVSDNTTQANIAAKDVTVLPKRNFNIIYVVIICATSLLGLWIITHHPGKVVSGQTVGDYIQQMRPVLLSQMNTPSSEVRRLIERIHGPTITFKDAEITGLTAKTIDGSDRAGSNGDNISMIDMIVTCRWKGWLQDNGYTEIEFSFDNQAKTMGAPHYLASNAAINVDTIDWGDVALKLGTAYLEYEQSQSQSQSQ